ncbi:putative shaggy-related protein kinase eta-like isoform X1 [Sesbania bispinosa]|nr:putative shaggy-related protein kinase eta-like isoform X1 [Sesbania bispinosa]
MTSMPLGPHHLQPPQLAPLPLPPPQQQQLQLLPQPQSENDPLKVVTTDVSSMETDKRLDLARRKFSPAKIEVVLRWP